IACCRECLRRLAGRAGDVLNERDQDRPIAVLYWGFTPQTIASWTPREPWGNRMLWNLRIAGMAPQDGPVAGRPMEHRGRPSRVAFLDISGCPQKSHGAE